MIAYFILNRLYWLSDWTKGIFAFFIGIGLFSALGLGIFRLMPSSSSGTLESNAFSESVGEVDASASYDLKESNASSGKAEEPKVESLEAKQSAIPIEPEKSAEDLVSEEVETEVQESLVQQEVQQQVEQEAEPVEVPNVAYGATTAANSLTDKSVGSSEFVAEDARKSKESAEKTIKSEGSPVKKEGGSTEGGMSADHGELIEAATDIKERIKDARTYGVLPLLEGYTEMANRLKAEKKSSAHYDKLGIEMETVKLLLSSRIGFIARDIKKFREGKIESQYFQERIAIYTKDATQILSTYDLDN